jgi:hypothetical protein
MKSLRNSISIMRFRTGKIFLFVFPALLLIGLSASFAAEFWESKTYYEWTDKECTRLLTDSPWAWELKLFNIGSLGGSDAAGGQKFISYAVQLRSALPIRQALVRRAQIASKYDSMSNEQKQAFDKNLEAFLNADFSDKVVVNITYSTNVQSLQMPMDQWWQPKTTPYFANSAFLYAEKGEKAKLLQYIPGQVGQREFQFVFPRLVGGKPVVTEQNKSLIVEFAYASAGTSTEGVNEGKGFAEFKVKKMILNGTLVY